MSDNTLQFRWIVTIQGNLDAMYRDRPDVFVAGDLLWYPVEGNNTIRAAPDTMVAFGRPKGHRGSYRQWEEGGIAPQVVFEVLSPGNRLKEMLRKLEFYDRYGVEEYYVFDPEGLELTGWRREGDRMVEIPQMNGWTSPRLGIRFELDSGDLHIWRPDGGPFLTFVELSQQMDSQRQRAEQERQRADRLAEKLRALGIDPSA